MSPISIANRSGFISKVSPSGKVETLKWVTGLDAPKGMALVGDKLYVADLTAVVIIDIKTAKILNRLEVDSAKFLNDVASSENGDVFISDSATGKIHILRKDQLSVYFQSQEFKRINGLLCLNDGSLYVADAGTGFNYILSKDKQLNKFTETSPGADGIVPLGKDEYLVSSWGGEVFYVDAKGKATKLLDTKEQKLNSADIGYDVKSKTVFVPTFFGNSVMAYRFVK
jgi:sugar lactone lactonase YvrE